MKIQFRDLLDSDATLLFHAKYVQPTEIKCIKRSIANVDIRRTQFLKGNIWINLRNLKNELLMIQNEIFKVFESYKMAPDATLIVGSDKDIFTQLLMNKFRATLPKAAIFAVDEGIGYYKKDRMQDEFMKITYKVMTPLIFGTSIQYLFQLGKHPLITDVFARFPEMIPSKRRNVNYHKILQEYRSNKKIAHKNKVLIFSFPHLDYQMTLDRKITMFKEIVANFPKNHSFYIKQHPREAMITCNPSDSLNNRVFFLERSKQGELIDYFEYDFIVNYSSSIVLDILESRYPANRIVTIGSNSKPRISIFNKTCFVGNENIEKLHELLN